MSRQVHTQSVGQETTFPALAEYRKLARKEISVSDYGSYKARHPRVVDVRDIDFGRSVGQTTEGATLRDTTRR